MLHGFFQILLEESTLAVMVVIVQRVGIAEYHVALLLDNGALTRSRLFVHFYRLIYLLLDLILLDFQH